MDHLKMMVEDYRGSDLRTHLTNPDEAIGLIQSMVFARGCIEEPTKTIERTGPVGLKCS